MDPGRRMKNIRSVGLLYLWSADAIRKGAPNGLEGALGEFEFVPGEDLH